ncbi:hypothetical protein FGIG_03959 [Fasciola gigantica]|uniref:XPG N-terminal domain-containing protein n=1 Tax=Fasciola gigantica TaxID=46835 RepID=A0A504YY68_FASGI|nr:hypothetical protein FGIG_03959 [Fasciola gigantica]
MHKKPTGDRQFQQAHLVWWVNDNLMYCFEQILMGISNLNNYMKINSGSFLPQRLCKTYVVDDALNFLGQLKTSHTTHHLGGEYSRLYGEMLKYLGMLAACDLVPIFVFDGSHNREVCL